MQPQVLGDKARRLELSETFCHHSDQHNLQLLLQQTATRDSAWAQVTGKWKFSETDVKCIYKALVPRCATHPLKGQLRKRAGVSPSSFREAAYLGQL